MYTNRYHLKDKIAQGGTAEVFRAIQSNSLGFKRTVAIKRILPQHIGNASQEAMLVTEAKLLVTLNHPNIVKVYDLGCAKGAYFFVMEFIDGSDLRTVIDFFQRSGHLLPVECTVLIAAELCKALEYIHGKTDEMARPLDLVHLDLSPKNILISRSGEVKLSDFGIADFQMRESYFYPTGDNPETVVRGKFAYMSPEQALGYPVDGRSDIFSLGLMLYELLVGRRLYRSRILRELQKEHRKQPVLAPLLPDRVPEELEYIVLNCLAFEPEKRYQTARQVFNDLVHFLYNSLGTIPHQQLAFMMEEILTDHLKAGPKSTRQKLRESETETDLHISPGGVSRSDSLSLKPVGGIHG